MNTKKAPLNLKGWHHNMAAAGGPNQANDYNLLQKQIRSSSEMLEDSNCMNIEKGWDLLLNIKDQWDQLPDLTTVTKWCMVRTNMHYKRYVKSMAAVIADSSNHHMSQQNSLLKSKICFTFIRHKNTSITFQIKFWEEPQPLGPVWKALKLNIINN